MPETASEFELVGRLPTSPADLVTTDPALRAAIGRIDGNIARYVELASALIKLGLREQAAGNYSEAEAFFGKALVVGERALGFDHPALLPALTGLGAVRMLRGATQEAQGTLARALTLSEKPLGEEQPELVILLNDLARICLKQSIPEFAEPPLVRMLAIKRAKGEDRPEVATVLASLAFVHQSMGRHTSAEQLWTRVVEIREQTLAPNHLSVATALEHLADACTARGKITQALALLQRAQTIREITLGKDHSSLRVSRERVADLQLQASEDLLEHEDVDAPTPLPDLGRLGSGEARGTPGAPPARERIVATHGWSTPDAPETIQASPIAFSKPDPQPRASAENSGVSFFEERSPASFFDTPTAAAVATAQSEAVPYREMILSMKAELEPGDEEGPTLGARATAVFASVVEIVRRRDRSVEIGVAAMTLVLIAFAGTRAWGKMGNSAETGAVNSAPVSPAAYRPTAGLPSVTANESSVRAPAVNVSTPSQSGSRSRAVDRPAPAKAKSTSQAAIGIASLPKAVNVNLDSVVGSMNTPTRDIGQSILSLPTASGNTTRSSFGADEATPPQRAKLIGSMPVPRYPVQLSHVGGEVRIRFMVDQVGRPMMATFSVMSSPDARLTAAVREVVPRMRFEPALTEGPSAKPTSEWVETAFRFER